MSCGYFTFYVNGIDIHTKKTEVRGESKLKNVTHALSVWRQKHIAINRKQICMLCMWLRKLMTYGVAILRQIVCVMKL